MVQYGLIVLSSVEGMRLGFLSQKLIVLFPQLNPEDVQLADRYP